MATQVLLNKRLSACREYIIILVSHFWFCFGLTLYTSDSYCVICINKGFKYVLVKLFYYFNDISTGKCFNVLNIILLFCKIYKGVRLIQYSYKELFNCREDRAILAVKNINIM